MPGKGKHSAAARKVFRIEATAIANLSRQLTADFDRSVKAILGSKGRVVVSGIGKSGSIAKKISATLASTGTPSFFLHPTEAQHGDLGMIEGKDILILISYSGETEELLRLIPSLRARKNFLIAISGTPGSTLVKNANAFLNVKVHKEACPLDLAPTSSTTATLAMGDALAVALIQARKFKAEDFAAFHPGGSLGRKLLTTVGDVMRKEKLPLIAPSGKISTVIHTMTRGRLGLAIVHEKNKIRGIITDGDLRRAMEKYGPAIHHLSAASIMTKKPRTIRPDVRISEAEDHMRKLKITSLLVAEGDSIRGVIQLHSFT